MAKKKAKRKVVPKKKAAKKVSTKPKPAKTAKAKEPEQLELPLSDSFVPELPAGEEYF